MAVLVQKTFSTVCTGQLHQAIQDNVVIVTNLEQIVYAGGATTDFWFANALSVPEDAELDSILAGWSCAAEPVETDGYILDDTNGPGTDIIWSSDKITGDFVEIAGDDMTGSLKIQDEVRIKHPSDSNQDILIQPGSGASPFGASISKIGASGFLHMMPNAATVQWLIADDASASGVNNFYWDVDNQGTMWLMTLPGAGRTGTLIATYDGVLRPGEDGTSELGTSSFRWENVYSDAADIDGNITITGNVDGVDVGSPKGSIEVDTNQYQLDGDAATPGVNKLYGTNGSGVKGWYDQPAGASGEINTASNLGAGVGVFDGKVGVDLQFRSLVSQNTLLSITLDAVNDEIDFTVNVGNIDHDSLLNTHNLTTDIDHDLTTNFVANEHIDHTTVTLQAGAGLAGGGDITANRSFSVNVVNSVEISGDNIQLVGDAASPGNNYLYGTNASGVKGWYVQPSGGGASLQLNWEFKNIVTSGDPGTGNFRLNNANPALATELYLSEEDKDGVDATNLLNALTADDRIYIQEIEDSTRWILIDVVTVVDNGTWFTITFTVDDSGVIFTDGKESGFVLLYNSIGGGDVTAAANLTDNSIIRGDGGAKGIQDAFQWTIADNGAMQGIVSTVLDGTPIMMLRHNGASARSFLEMKNAAGTDLFDFRMDTAQHPVFRVRDGSNILFSINDGAVKIGETTNDTDNNYVLLVDDGVFGIRNALGDTAGFSVPASMTPYTLTLPDAYGTNGQILTTTAGGVLSWEDPATGDVTAAANIVDHSIVRGDGGVKGVQDSEQGTTSWTIADNGKLVGIGDNSGDYIMTIRNLNATSGSGMLLKAGEALGDIAFSVEDSDGTFIIMECEADQGFVTFGKSYAQTLADNGNVYGVDNQNGVGGGSADFNTQTGTYRRGGYNMLEQPPSTDLTGTGSIVSATIDTNATGFGAALYMAADGNFDEADADSASTMPCRALALESGIGSKAVLLRGFIRNDAWNWTPGSDVYVSTTTGALTQTAPSGSGDQVQKIGFAWSADIIYFQPGDYTIVEVA